MVRKLLARILGICSSIPPNLGGEGAGAVAVVVVMLLLRAFVPVCTEEGGELQIHDRLQAACGQFGNQLTEGVAIL